MRLHMHSFRLSLPGRPNVSAFTYDFVSLCQKTQRTPVRMYRNMPSYAFAFISPGTPAQLHICAHRDVQPCGVVWRYGQMSWAEIYRCCPSCWQTVLSCAFVCSKRCRGTRCATSRQPGRDVDNGRQESKTFRAYNPNGMVCYRFAGVLGSGIILLLYKRKIFRWRTRLTKVMETSWETCGHTYWAVPGFRLCVC